ncbi:hypothetical protein [Paenibacillus sp. GYB003]|uniref:hypothetical protein n=1 Tax=Paenibacillus sp. GYB003 TaxID=2994392 RepID=UPI002F962F56
MRKQMRNQLAVLIGAAVLTTGGLTLPDKAARAETAAAVLQPQAEPQQTAAEAAEPGYVDIVLQKAIAAARTSVAASVYNENDDTAWPYSTEGQSLAAVTGWSESELETALLRSVTEAIARDLESGVLTANEASDASAAATAAVHKTVSGPAAGASAAASSTKGAAIVQSFLDTIVQRTADLLELSARDLRSALGAGQTLAQAAGQTEAQLGELLKQSLNGELDRAAASGSLSSAEAIERKRDGAEAIDTIVATVGYDRETTPWMERFGESLLANKLGFAATLTATWSDKESDDFFAALAQGGTLASASGLSESELLALLTDYVDEAIDGAWLDGDLSAEYAGRLKTRAAELVKTAISTPGYGMPTAPAARVVYVAVPDADSADAAESYVAEVEDLDADAYAADRLNRVVADIAALTGTNGDELLRRLSGGLTIGQAVHTDADSLLYSLVGSFGKEVNNFVAAGALSEEDGARAKSNYTSGLLKLLTSR